MNHESLCISINHNIIALREHSFYLKTKEKKKHNEEKEITLLATNHKLFQLSKIFILFKKK